MLGFRQCSSAPAGLVVATSRDGALSSLDLHTASHVAWGCPNRVSNTVSSLIATTNVEDPGLGPNRGKRFEFDLGVSVWPNG